MFSHFRVDQHNVEFKEMESLVLMIPWRWISISYRRKSCIISKEKQPKKQCTTIVRFREWFFGEFEQHVTCLMPPFSNLLIHSQNYLTVNFFKENKFCVHTNKNICMGRGLVIRWLDHVNFVRRTQKYCQLFVHTVKKSIIVTDKMPALPLALVFGVRTD